MADVREAHAGDVVPRWRADPIHAGQRLRTLRERSGLNQQELVRQVDLTHEEISRLEQGEKSPQAPTVHKLSPALRILSAQFVDDMPLGLQLLSVREAGHLLGVSGKWVQI